MHACVCSTRMYINIHIHVAPWPGLIQPFIRAHSSLMDLLLASLIPISTISASETKMPLTESSEVFSFVLMRLTAFLTNRSWHREVWMCSGLG